MKLGTSLFALTLLCILTGCAAPSPSGETTASAPAGVRVDGNQPSGIPWQQTMTIEAEGPAVVDFSQLPTVQPGELPIDFGAENRPEMPRSWEEVEAMRAEAMLLPPDPDIPAVTEGTNLALGVSFPAIDFTSGGTGTPPDPELAVGMNHVIAVVNSSFEIYDKTGTSVSSGPVSFATFFAGTPGYQGNPFDPNALYDEAADRYFVGIDSAGDAYCFAVTQTGDPTGLWNKYCFGTLIGPVTLFDYPHAGIGWDAIYMGSNQFAGSFVEARVWAIDKVAAYAGNPVTTVTHSTGQDSTPMPANFHGASDGSFPTSGPHWIMTEAYDGCIHNVWTWTDPFNANTFTMGADLDLCAASGVTAGQAVNWPQLGGSAIQGNDFRGQSTEYRNGELYMANQTISCNPGGGTVDCARWARIDPVANTVLDAGVLASPGDYRTFANVAANVCGDMAMGYSKGNSAMFPATWVAARESGDPAGTLQTEQELKAGEGTFSCFDGSPFRWGDYTGMTIDPDGVTFWYLGQYSKPQGTCSWANYIGSFTFPNCTADTIFTDGFESGDTTSWEFTILP